MRANCFLGLAILFAICLAAPATLFALEPFTDDFERADNGEVGNDWEEEEDDGISISIVGGEVLIQGTQDLDWERNGIARDVNDISSISFDFLADDVFNVHIRIDDTVNGGYIDAYAWPDGPFSFANAIDENWPGWVAIEGSEMVAGEYNSLGIEKTGANTYQIMLNGAPIGAPLENAGMSAVNRIMLTPDSAVDAVGSLHIDNVVIDGGLAAVEPSSKLSTSWGEIKSSF